MLFRSLCVADANGLRRPMVILIDGSRHEGLCLNEDKMIRTSRYSDENGDRHKNGRLVNERLGRSTTCDILLFLSDGSRWSRSSSERI